MTIESLIKNKEAQGTGARVEQHFIECDSTVAVNRVITDFHEKAAPEKTLVIFDADETLIRQKDTHIGSHEWFSQSIEYLRSKKGLTFEQARQIVIELRDELHYKNDLALADSGWPTLIQSLEEKKVERVVLTRRTQPMAELTTVWFDRLNLRMSENYFGVDHIVDLQHDKAAHHKGKLFCGNNEKGDTLLHFLRLRHAVTPYQENMHIVFIDDREEYHACVARGLTQFAEQHEINVAFYGIHFTALHVELKSFFIDEETIVALERLYERYFKKPAENE